MPNKFGILKYSEILGVFAEKQMIDRLQLFGWWLEIFI